MALRFNADFCGRSLVGTADSNPTGSWVSVFERCVLSGRGLCDGPTESSTECVIKRNDLSTPTVSR
jgi:hypothetical protein